MRLKKRKSSRRTPDLTVEVDGPLQVFTDKPRAGAKRRSPGVVTSYDPAVIELAERLRRETPQHKQTGPASNGHLKVEAGKTDRQRLKDLEAHLNNCVNLAEAIGSKRAVKIAQLLRDARTQVQQLRG